MEDANQQVNNDVDNEENFEEFEDPSYNSEGEVLDNNDTFEKLKRNDPAIADIELVIPLNCSDGHFFNKISWEEDGYCIGFNTHIKRVMLTYYGNPFDRPYNQPYILGEQGNDLPTRQQLQDFFSCIYRNSSIKQLIITSRIGIIDDFGGSLIEGLGDHHSLKRLQIEYDFNTAEQARASARALGKVLKHPKSELKHLLLPNNNLDDIGLGVLCDGLLGNSKITVFYLDNNRHITSIGWQALSTVLQHPNCKLTKLSLNWKGLNDEGSNILGSALSGLSSLKELDLSQNESIGSGGWHTLLNHLAQTSIVRLNLRSNKIDNGGLASLANMSTLQSLDISMNNLCTPSGWWTFFKLLQRIGSQLKKLDISCNKVGDVGVAALGSLLSSANTLKTLEMSSMRHPDDISAQGWISFFNTLQDSNVDLVELVLANNHIDDEGIQLLVPLLSRMSSLTQLNLSSNRSVTPTGWQTLSGFLQMNCALEGLELAFGNNLNDNTIISFTSALIHNKMLTRLSLATCFNEDNNETITERGWQAASNLLCNTTSILDTYNSNHTLHIFSGGDHNIAAYSRLNENKDKVEVARQKILHTHFSNDGTSKIQELLDMDLEMMPTAISWIGRPTRHDWKGESTSGLSTMYNLTRRLPDLFDSSSQKKKSSAGKRKYAA